MTQAFNRKDMDAIMSTYETPATIMFEPGVAEADREKSIGKSIGFFAVDPNFTFADHQVIVNGDIAVHTTPWTMTGTMPDGQKITRTGLSIAVLRRQKDGTWLMVIYNPYGDLVIAARGAK